MAGDVTITITGDAESLKRSLGEASSSLASFADKAQKVGERATSIGRSMTFGVTLPLIALGKVAFDELQQSAAASAQTAAAIKSTGGAAHVTATQVDEMASSLLRKTGIDDEVIKGGENVLLTFRGIRNEAGKGNDIFNQATKATLDLSVAFGKDMTSSAILVGKALQDPIQGVSALRRVGVQLNEQQVANIKSFVEQGDVMSAQKIILKELTTEVGGSAKAYGDSFAGQASKAKEELKNVSAQILATALPAMRELTSVGSALAHGFAELPEPVQAVVVSIGALAAAAGPVVYIFGAVSKAVSGAIAVAGALSDAFVAVERAAVNLSIRLAEIGIAGIAPIAGFVAVLGGITLAVYGVGKAIDSVFNTDVTGRGSFGQVLDAVDEGKKRGAEWAAVIIAGAKASGSPLDELRARLDTLRASQLKAGEAAQRGAYSESQLVEVSNRYSTAIGTTKAAIAQLKQEQAEARAATEAQRAAVHDLASGTTDWANATDDAKSAILDLQSAVLAASGGELALQQANLNLTKAQQDYTDALNAGDPSKITEAELNLQQARLGVASATLNAQDASQKLLDIVHEGPDAVQAEIDKLKSAQTQYGDTSGAIQDQIDKLFWLNLSINGLPDNKPVSIDLSVKGIESLNYTKDTINDLTSREHRVMVELGGDALGYLTQSDRNIKHNITPVSWN